MKHLLSFLFSGVLILPGIVRAITIDGTVDAAYGSARSIQTVQTAFGDEDGVGAPNGGELNAGYLAIEGGRLYIAITGNIETDSFNNLSLFIDSRSGGESTLAVQNYGFNDVGRNLGAISFQSGFNPDFHLYARAGGGNFEVDFIDRQNGASSNVLGSTGTAALSGDYGIAIGSTGAGTPNGSGIVGAAVASPVEFALNNSNSAAVTTGVEFSIALSDLGANPGDTIQVVAGYSNGDYNFWSNQFLGGLAAPQGNLGADGSGNFVADASGTSLDLSGATPFSITVIPEPSSVILLGLSLVPAGLLAWRERTSSTR